jgi:formyl-CoA transferase
LSDPRFQTLKARVDNIDFVDELVSAFTRQRTRDDLFALLMQHRVPCAPVRTLIEVVNDPHLHERGMLQWIDHPEFGRIAVQASPMRYNGAPQLPHQPSAKLGANTAEVLAGWLDLSTQEIARLNSEGAIAC